MIQALVEVRDRLNLDQQKFARKLGLSPSYICKLESGDAPMTYRAAKRYAEACHRSRKYFESFIPEERR